MRLWETSIRSHAVRSFTYKGYRTSVVRYTSPSCCHAQPQGDVAASRRSGARAPVEPQRVVHEQPVSWPTRNVVRWTLALGLALALGRRRGKLSDSNGIPSTSGTGPSPARVKDPATIDIGKGWCRLMGLVGPTLLLTAALAIRNLAIADAFEVRRADDERRQRVGLAPRTRRRRRTTLSDLVGASP